MKITVLAGISFIVSVGLCEVVAEYPVCGQPSSSMSGCCMLSQGALRCTEVTCPDGYYNVVSSSTCSDSETSLEDNEVPAQNETTVTHQGAITTLALSLSTTTPQSVSGESKDDVSANQSDSDAASFKPLTSEAPKHLLENTSHKASPFDSTAEDNSSDVETSQTSVTPMTSPHVFCCQCHESCLTCSDKGPEHCLSCAPGFDWRSTNTTERCLVAAASSSSTSYFYLLIILIILPISLCSVVIAYRSCRRRQGKSTNDDFGVNMPFIEIISSQKICDYNVKTYEDVSFNGLLAIREKKPTLSPHKHCLVPQDENQKITPLVVGPQYRCDLPLTTKAVLSRRQVEDVPRSVESVSVLSCEARKSQSMTEVRTSDSMKPFSQMFTTKARNNSTMPNCSFHSIAYSDSEPEPIYREIPDTRDSVDAGDTQTVLQSCVSDYLLRDIACKRYISDRRTHSEIMNAFDSSSLNTLSSFSLLSDSDNGACQLSLLPISSGYGRPVSPLYEQRLISSPHEILNKDNSSLPSPIISPQWQISETFSRSGGVLKIASCGVCLEVGEGAVEIRDVVTIHGAVSTDLTNAYDVLPLPEDEVIVSPVAEFFAGFRFQFEKPVRIVLPHFLSLTSQATSLMCTNFILKMDEYSAVGFR